MNNTEVVHREQTSDQRGQRGRIGVGECEVQTIGYKIDSMIYCTTRGIQSIFCNNYEWKVTFKLYKIKMKSLKMERI